MCALLVEQGDADIMVKFQDFLDFLEWNRFLVEPEATDEGGKTAYDLVRGSEIFWENIRFFFFLFFPMKNPLKFASKALRAGPFGSDRIRDLVAGGLWV